MAQQPPNNFGGGAPTERAVEEFGAQIEKSKQSPYLLLNPSFITVAGDPQGATLESRLATKAANSSKFPIRGFPSDPYDSMWSMKDDLARPVTLANGVTVPSIVTERRPLPIVEQDIAYLKRKRDAEENLSYLAWQANKYDLNDPATRDWFEKRCPSYFDQRESLIEQQIDLAARYAKIRLRGAKTEDDLKLEYFIETDRITLPKGPVWDPYAWVSMEAGTDTEQTVNHQQTNILSYNRNAYRKGLFNPTKVSVPQTSGMMQNPYNQGDIAGYPDTQNTGIRGAPVAQTMNYLTAYGPFGNDRGLFGARTAANTTVPALVNNAAVNEQRITLAKSPAGRTGVGFNAAPRGQYAAYAGNQVYNQYNHQPTPRVNQPAANGLLPGFGQAFGNIP